VVPLGGAPWWCNLVELLADAEATAGIAPCFRIFEIFDIYLVAIGPERISRQTLCCAADAERASLIPSLTNSSFMRHKG